MFCECCGEHILTDKSRLSPQLLDKQYGTKTCGMEDIQMTLTSPRHYQRRRALVESEMQDDVSSSTIRAANVKHHCIINYTTV